MNIASPVFLLSPEEIVVHWGAICTQNTKMNIFGFFENWICQQQMVKLFMNTRLL